MGWTGGGNTVVANKTLFTKGRDPFVLAHIFPRVLYDGEPSDALTAQNQCTQTCRRRG
jgi:hypothetical protein